MGEVIMDVKRESNGRFAKGWGRAVVGFNEDTGDMVLYESIAKAVDDGFHRTRISECCSKGRGKHKGFVWKYLDEHEEGI